MTLTLKYRPKKFSETVGQPHVIPVLRAFVANDNPPPVLVFAGSAGCGKTSTARVYAAALNCKLSSEGDACGKCEACKSVQNNSSEFYIEMDAASHGGVSDVLNIREWCMYTHFSLKRVVVIDEAQALSRDAFQALLKIFEEPPPDTVFLLLTTEPEKIPDTVRSRAISFEFRTIPKVDVAKRVALIAKNEGFKLHPLLAARIAQRTKGHLRDALMELEKCMQVNITQDSDYLKFVGEVNVALPILAAVAYGATDVALQNVDTFFSSSSDLKKFVDHLADAIISVSKAYVGIPSSEGIAELARTFSRDSLMRAFSLVWEAYDRLRVSHNPKIVAQMLVTMMVKELAVVEPPEVEIVDKPEEKSIIDSDTDMTIEQALAMLE